MFVAFGSMLLLLASELSLHLLAAMFPKIDYLLSEPWTRVTRADPKLGFRPSPYYPGHDAWGFRNAQVPQTCDVLTIGDSMTYGYSAQSGESWPERIEKRLDVSLYNMSFGGYGPYEYLQLLREGLALHPRVVIVGLFLGNDISDSYSTVYLKDRGARFLTLSTQVQYQIMEADLAGMLPDLADRYLYPELNFPLPPEEFSMRAWVSENLATWGLIRQLRFTWDSSGYKSPFREDSPERDRFEIASKRPERYAYDGDRGGMTTFLPPRALALRIDIQDPRIVEGYRILKATFSEMHKHIEAAGAKLVVLLIPTKQMVYRELIAEQRGPGSEILLQAIADEAQWTRQLEEFFAGLEVPTVNSTELISRALMDKRKPYPVSEDGHPNGIGYAQMANACEGLVRRLLQQNSNK